MRSDRRGYKDVESTKAQQGEGQLENYRRNCGETTTPTSSGIRGCGWSRQGSRKRRNVQVRLQCIRRSPRREVESRYRQIFTARVASRTPRVMRPHNFLFVELIARGVGGSFHLVSFFGRPEIDGYNSGPHSNVSCGSQRNSSKRDLLDSAASQWDTKF